MADLGTIAELGTAAGTLVLGAATFASVRSANHAARVAERSLLLGLRPVLSPSRPEDPDQKIIFGDGLAVLQRYDILTENPLHESRRSYEEQSHARDRRQHRPLESFRLQQRDLYIANGDTGYWQAALRDPEDSLHREVSASLAGKAEPISVDLLYGDHEGGQHTVSRFNLVPRGGSNWFCSVVFHWQIEAPDPRELE